MAKSLPGLWRAEKIQTKAARAGFEWPNAQAALDKLAEELAELQQAVAEDSNIEEELGDLLFAAVKVARFFHIDAEEALAGTCEKFIRRFSGVEAAVKAVVWDKNITEQAEVDAMAKAIEEAIEALEKKPVPPETPSGSGEPETGVPATGDASSTAVWMVFTLLGMVGFAAAGTMAFKRKKVK